MAWKKLGKVFSPDNQNLPGLTHAALPVPFHISDNIYRIFFASRDKRNYSSVYSMDIELNGENWNIIDLPSSPLLEPGPAGYFDDCGVYASSIVQHDDLLYLYYIGWSTGGTAPMFYANVGLAISSDRGKTFKKFSAAPICGRDHIDPWMMTAPYVMKLDDKFLMWYVGGERWDVTASPWESYYSLKFAESPDGVSWIKTNQVCLPLKPGEKNISRTCVLPKKRGYECWYGCNFGDGYRIGYAKSLDGKSWHRRDSEAGITVSKRGWDSESISYPFLITEKGRRYMFYNGNGFGKTGFGLAVESGQCP